MKLVGAEIAEISEEKIYDYCLDPNHPVGAHKARVFKSALDIDQSNAERLMTFLRESLSFEDAHFVREDIFGKHYRIDHEVVGLKGKEILRSLWVIEREGHPPRFVSCYLRRK
jgi:hypothetical protein